MPVSWSPRCCAGPQRRRRDSVAVALLGLLRHYWTAGQLQPLYGRPPRAGSPGGRLLGQAQRPCRTVAIVIYDAPWVDLHEPTADGPAFPNAHTHWKVALDPAIRGGVFEDDWRTVDYLLMSGDLRQSFADTGNVSRPGGAGQRPASSGAGTRTARRSSCGR